MAKPLQDHAADERRTRDLERVRGELRQAKDDLASARATIRDQEGELTSLRALSDLKVELHDVPDWLVTPRVSKKSRHEAIACLLLSDLHLDEVVNPDEMHGLNSYDRNIAVQRLERVVSGTEFLTSKYLNDAYLDWRGIVVMLGGDTFSGDIHPELKETNEGPTPESIRFWFPRIRGALLHLADVYGHVHVMAVPGNHGRLSVKPRYKKRATDNVDWLLAGLIADSLAEDKRFTFDVGESDDAIVTVYDTTFLLTHGDQTNGGGGIGGIWPPIKRLQARKLERYRAVNTPFEWLVMGHWHQYVHAQGMIVNGSLKGYDEFAALHNFAPERAQQAFWIVTPENGVTGAFPVIGADPKAEGWARKQGARVRGPIKKGI